MAVAAGYVVYVVRAHLTARNAFGWDRFASLRAGGKARLTALNALSTWSFYSAGLGCLVSGIWLSASFSDLVLDVHIVCFWVTLAFPLLHVFLHLRLGGLGQLARIVRPTVRRSAEPPPDLTDIIVRLIEERESGRQATDLDHDAPARQSFWRRPLAMATGLAVLVVGLCLTFDVQLGRPLEVARIGDAEAPWIDGDLADEAWTRATAAHVTAGHGGDFGGKGETDMEIRAVRDARYLYIAITWTDPTRSISTLPIQKRDGKWQLVRNPAAEPGNEVVYGDRLAVMMAPAGRHILGAAIHLGERPLEGAPASQSGRGLHYLKRGLADLWEWSPVADLSRDGQRMLTLVALSHGR